MLDELMQNASCLNLIELLALKKILSERIENKQKSNRLAISLNGGDRRKHDENMRLQKEEFGREYPHLSQYINS